MGQDHRSDTGVLSRLSRQSGLSLIELMIALTLGLLLLSAVASFYVAQSRNQRELSNQFGQVENGRYAIEQLSYYLGNAGFYGNYLYMDQLPDSGSSLPDGCEKDASKMYTASGVIALAYAVQGAVSGSVASTFTCVTGNNIYPGSDALLVRGADPTPVASASLVSSSVYLQAAARIRTPIIAGGDSPGSFTLTNLDGSAAAIRRYPVRIFYVGRCVAATTCNATDDEPALRLLEVGNNSYSDAALVEGIERLVVEYGLDLAGDNHSYSTSSGGTRIVQHDGKPDLYQRTLTTSDEWSSVVAVRVTLVARANHPTAGYTDTKTYTLASGLTYTPSGTAATYRRKLFRKTIYLTNVGNRRE